MPQKTNCLGHDAGLAVTISVDLGVDLLTERRLASGGVVGTVGASGTGVTSDAGASDAGASRGRAGGTSNGARLASEAVMTGLTSSERAALGLELVHGHGGESRCSVVLGSVVVNLVHWNSGVLNVRLDGLLLDDRLDDLVDMVMSVLASDHRGLRMSVSGLAVGGGIPELSGLLLKLLLDGSRVAMVVLTVLDGDSLVLMNLGQNLTVLDRLDGGVVVVLVNLTVDGTFALSARGLELQGVEPQALEKHPNEPTRGKLCSCKIFCLTERRAFPKMLTTSMYQSPFRRLTPVDKECCLPVTFSW